MKIRKYLRSFRMTFCFVLATILIITIFSAPVWSSMATVAIVSKVVQDVTKKTGTTDWKAAKKGDQLTSGDLIRTGDRSIAIVKFKDNSIVRVRERTELKIQAELKGNTFSKSVDINSGVIGFDVKKQEDEQFTITSPTSIASIRGTSGLYASADTGDVLTLTTGLVIFRNLASNTTLEVGGGQTATSRPDGRIEVHPSSQQERDRARGALRSGEEGERELKIEMRDPQGNKKDLKIRYRD